MPSRERRAVPPTPPSSERPIVYLDVDGVLWTLRDRPRDPTGATGDDLAQRAQGAPGVDALLRWLTENTEVRWLTAWAVSGTMRREDLIRLSRYTGLPRTLLERVRPGGRWWEYKTEGIDWEAHARGREWVWLDDDLLQGEARVLAEHDCLGRHIRVDVFEEPRALLRVLEQLKERFGSRSQAERAAREQMDGETREPRDRHTPEPPGVRGPRG